METDAIKQRLRFAHDFFQRYHDEGEAGLVERARTPHGCPHRTSSRLEELVLEARKRYGWGAKKLLQVLKTRHPRLAWPARSTLNEILERHGKLRKNRRRKK